MLQLASLTIAVLEAVPFTITSNMETPTISIKSTKAQIVEAANEFIDYQDVALRVATRKLHSHRQALCIVTVLLAVTFIISPAF